MAVNNQNRQPVNMETTRANDFAAQIFAFPNTVLPNGFLTGIGAAIGSATLANRFNQHTSLVANPSTPVTGPSTATAEDKAAYRERVLRRARKERAARAERVRRRQAQG